MNITRIWHGRTRAHHADDYLKFLEEVAMPDYQKVPGNLSAKIWRRIDGDVCHFHTVTEWDAITSIKGFAGEDFEKAVYYEEDKEFLLDFEEQVLHFETFVYKK